MIVKTISHRSAKPSAIKKLIHYVFNKHKMQDRFHNRAPVTVKRFIKTYDKDKWTSQFKINDDRRTFNHAKRTVLRHELIAFSPKDHKHLTREILKDFAQFYLKHRSATSLGVAGVHYEESVHIHFIISGVGIDGKSTRISQKEFKDFKIKLQKFQREKYPELSHSIVPHSKKKVSTSS